jgi:hypothetical protein
MIRIAIIMLIDRLIFLSPYASPFIENVQINFVNNINFLILSSFRPYHPLNFGVSSPLPQENKFPIMKFGRVVQV